MEYIDLFLNNKNKKIKEKAEKLGWQINRNYDIEIIDEEDWGELKKQTSQRKQEDNILVVKGGDYELHKKVVKNENVDILLSPEKNRKDSGIDHVVAKSAAKNNTAIAHNFTYLRKNSAKIQSHILSHWKKNHMLLQKYNGTLIITTKPNNIFDLRNAQNLEVFLNTHNISSDVLSENPQTLLSKVNS